ncbi:MAG: hypothetical protein IKU88_06440 [Alistipes sp.]|nr:hypothetical protein [Alistipes sp.]
MKKLFVSLMAIAALVSCSKDEVGNGPALDSANKTVSITIVNGNGGSRAAGDAGITAPGAGTTANGVTTMASAEATDLDVLFADASGTILKVMPLVNTGAATDETHGTDYTAEYVPGTTGEANTYIWHNVPWDVTQIAVVRYYKGAPAAEGVDAIPADITIVEKTTKLSAVAALASNEALNLGRGLSDIVLYGVDTQLEDLNTTHEVDGVSYHYWKADVTVTPALARFEINNIECTNLGVYNLATNTDRTKYGFDELDVLSLSWKSTANNTYQIAKATDATKIGTLYGQYVPAEGATLKEANTYAGSENRANGDADDLQAGAGKVWSWNVAANTTFDGMTVGLKAHAYDYSLQEAGQNLTLNVTGLATSANATTANANTFAAANIYQLNLAFTEENVKDQDALCVQVVVTVTPWTINTIYPVFGN